MRLSQAFTGLAVVFSTVHAGLIPGTRYTRENQNLAARAAESNQALCGILKFCSKTMTTTSTTITTTTLAPSTTVITASSTTTTTVTSTSTVCATSTAVPWAVGVFFKSNQTQLGYLSGSPPYYNVQGVTWNTALKVDANSLPHDNPLSNIAAVGEPYPFLGLVAQSEFYVSVQGQLAYVQPVPDTSYQGQNPWVFSDQGPDYGKWYESNVWNVTTYTDTSGTVQRVINPTWTNMGGDASSASNLLYSPGDDFVFLNAFVAADDCWDDSGAQISCPGDWAYPKFDVFLQVVPQGGGL